MEDREKFQSENQNKLADAQLRISELETQLSQLKHLHTLQHQSVQKLAKRLEALQTLDHAMLSATSLENLAQLTLTHIVQFIPCFRASIATIDLKAKTSYLLALYSEVEALFPALNTYALDETYIPSITNDAWTIIYNLDRSKNTMLQQLYEQGVRSLLLVPLRVDHRLIGLLSLHFVQSDVFYDETIQIALEMGQQIAIGIHKASLSDAVARYARRMDILHAIDTGLIEGASVKALVESTLKQIQRLIPCERIGLGIIDPLSQEVVIFTAHFNYDSKLSTGVRIPIPPKWFDGFDENRMRLIDDMRLLDDPTYQRLVEEGFKSQLQVLLQAETNTIGVMGFSSPELSFFTLEYQEIAREVGNQLAIALHQMHLSTMLERYALELEKKVAERTAELQMSKDQIEAVLLNSLDGILLIDKDLRIQQANPAVTRLLATELHNQEMVNLLDLIHPNYANHIRVSIERALTEQIPIPIEIQTQHQDGQTSNLELNFGYIPGDGFVSTLHDITARKQAEEALKQALDKEREVSKEKSHFVSVVSHEFRTPLASILMTADTLLAYRDRLNASQIDERLDRIRQNVRRMTDIMEDTLQLARIQAGRLEFHPRLGDMDALCRKLIEEFEDIASSQNRFTYTSTHSPMNVFFDERLMRQAMSNLFSNALKYSPADKSVNVDLRQEASRVVFSVTDQGIGIPPEDLEHLFEPFHRASNTGSISGTGLGLSITKQIVEFHGGTINVESQVGQGTSFRVIIPLGQG